MNTFEKRGTQRAAEVLRRRFKTAGLLKFLGGCLMLAAFTTTVSAGNVTLAWNRSVTPFVTGYKISYGGASHKYTSSVNAGSNLTATVSGLTPGLSYYWAVSDYTANGIVSSFSNEVTNRVPIPPSINVQPLTQTAVLGSPVTLSVSAAGDPTLSFQWFDGAAHIAGANSSVLSWSQILSANAGNYTVIVTNSWGSVTSSIAMLTVTGSSSIPLIVTQPQSQTVVLAKAASFSSAVSGPAPLSIQWRFGTTAIAGATNSTLAWASAAASNAGNYSFTVSNSSGSVTSSVVTLGVMVPPSVVTQPQSQTAVAAKAVSFSSAVSGTAPLSIQWRSGTTALAGATNSTLAWASVAASNAGNYSFTVSNPAGAVTSSVVTLSVIVPPSVVTQPQSQTVVAAKPASFSSAVSGMAPLSIQWRFGSVAIAGATNSTLAWASVAASNAGNYSFTVSNPAGAVTSSVATLTVLPAVTLATGAGVYNGLFFQTNGAGTAAVAEASAGLLGNCVVASNGVFSAKVCIRGSSYSLAGVFNSSGNAAVTIPCTNSGLSSLTAVLNLNLGGGGPQITGTMSSTTTGNLWTAPLIAELATNAYPHADVFIHLATGSATNAPAVVGSASGTIANGVLTLWGTLGDTATFSQTVAISASDYVPIYVSLYNNSGLLEGWLDLSGSVVIGNITWIRPAGVLVPTGFAGGFDTVLPFSGVANN